MVWNDEYFIFSLLLITLYVKLKLKY